MQNNIFLLPLYNDWQSLQRLLEEINSQIKNLKKKAEIFVIDDNSKSQLKINIKNFNNIKKINIIRLNKNLGSQKAISIGLRYIQSLKKKSIITVLDSDGEDDSSKILEMINCAEKNKNSIVVSCRSKRKEGIFFNLLYSIHKTITYLFSAKLINFGNYSSFDSKNLEKILVNSSTWFAYSSAVAKNCNIIKLFAERKKRFFGKSQLSFMGLFLHSLRVNCVFLPRIIILSIIYISLIFFFKEYLSLFFILIVFFIILFNVAMICIYLHVKPSQFYKSLKFIQKKTVL